MTLVSTTTTVEIGYDSGLVARKSSWDTEGLSSKLITF